MLIPARRRSLIAALAILAASTFFVTSIEAQIFHQHRSITSEITCPICHLFHRIAVQSISGQSMAHPHPLCLKVVPPTSFEQLEPSYSPNTPRAPPAV
jgi:hypothetical protein